MSQRSETPAESTPAPLRASGPGQPIDADLAGLQKLLASRPILWIGAGVSIQAGYPTQAELIEQMRADSDDPIAAHLTLPQVIDEFIASNGKGTLVELLSRELSGRVRQPTALHHAIARLASKGQFSAIITTNLDPLIEYSLHQYHVPHNIQVIEKNASLDDSLLRVFKVHGSHTDWLDAVHARSQQQVFDDRHPFLARQLDVALQQRSVLFVGCSMRSPRLLDWLASRDEQTAALLDRWRPMMTAASWGKTLASPWRQQTAAMPLSRGNVRPLLIRDPEHLSTLWSQVADALGAAPVAILAEDERPGPDEGRAPSETDPAFPQQAIAVEVGKPAGHLRIAMIALALLVGIALAAFAVLSRQSDSRAPTSGTESNATTTPAPRSTAGSAEQVAARLNREGLALWKEENDLVEAAKKLQLATDMSPAPIYYLNLCQVQHRLGRIEQAYPACRAALVHGAEDEAREQAEKLLADQQKAMQLNTEGQALWRKHHDLEGAMRKFRASIALTPHAAHYFNLCYVLHELGRWQQAQTSCREALSYADDAKLAGKIRLVLTSLEQRLRDAPE